jgi:hypothetical protein
MAPADAMNLMEKTGDIFLRSEKGRCAAYWHPVDGSRPGAAQRYRVRRPIMVQHYRGLFVSFVIVCC